MKYVNAPVMKKDAMALVTGKPVYMDDVAPKDCLIVKVLRSPHAHALIEEINITNALKQKGIECILTYKDVPHRRFTMAGQTFPEPSPYDRYILDQRVRFVGDAVAIVAGEDEAAVDRALKLNRCLTIIQQKITRFLSIRRRTGRHSVRLVQTINGTFVRQAWTVTEMWMVS